MGRFTTLAPPKSRFSKEILEETRFSQDALDVEVLEPPADPNEPPVGITFPETEPTQLPSTQMQIGAAPEPTAWQKVKQFFIADRPPLLPHASRMAYADRAFDIAIGSPLRVFLKFAKGRTLNVPDLVWAGIKKITPDSMWDAEVKKMNLDQAMDWAAGYNPSGFEKTVGGLAEFMGRLQTASQIGTKIGLLGGTPKDISVLTKASETAKLFGLGAGFEQITKNLAEYIEPTEAKYGAEGKEAIVQDMAIGAIFSIAHSGIGGIWTRLKPTEQARALKLLGLKKGATAKEITQATRNMALRTHPDKVKGLEEKFKRVMTARELLLKGPKRDIVYRKQPPKPPARLTGKVARIAAKPITKKEPLITPKAPAIEAEKSLTVQQKAVKGIEKIRKLDIKQRELEESADAMLRTSGVGQAPPVYHRELDKVIKIQKQKAEIWNDIRGSIAKPSHKTLWQLAIEKYPIKRFGKETALGIYAEDIDKLLAPTRPVAETKQTSKGVTTPKAPEAGEVGFYHGSPSGDLRGGKTGLHIGTYKAAKQALEARIGIPAKGEWDGTRKYGETLLAGQDTLKKLDPKGFNQTGVNVDVPKEDYYPTGKATYSDGTKVSMDIKPNIMPVKIKGEMINTAETAKGDFAAGATMAGQIKRGRAKRGYYYTNISEDAGSISAVVPSAAHLEAPAPPAREAWEMGITEHLQSTPKGKEADIVLESPEVVRHFGMTGKLIKYAEPHEAVRDQQLSIHKKAVQQAIKQGKPVPRAVLEEYKGESWAKQALKEKKYDSQKKKGRPLKELGGMPEQPPGLTKAEAEHLGKREATALRAGQKRGLPIGYKLGQREAEDKLNSFKFRVKQKDVNFKQIRDEMFDLVKKALPTYERGKTKVMSLLKSVSPEKTDKANRKDLMRAIAMTSKYAEEANQRDLRKQIYTELKKTKPKKKGGLLKGKYTADIQRKLDEIRLRIKYDREQARLQIANNIAQYEEGTLPYEDMRSANEQLAMRGIKGMTSAELQNVLDNIIALKETGKSIREAKKEAEDAHIKQAVGQATVVLTGGRGIKKGAVSVPRGELEARKTAIERIANWQYGWDNYLDKLSKFDKSSKMYKSDLSKFGASIHEAHNKEVAGVDKQINKAFGKFQEIFGLKTTSQVNAALNKLKQEVDLGIFKNADGEEVHLRLNKEQLMKKYQELQDPTLDATFRGGVTEEGKVWGMRWTDEIIEAVNNSLSSQEKAWADYHLQFYQEYYPTVNEVYREIYGVDLPHNLYYSPIGRDIEADIPENVLLAKESAHYASTVNGSLKSRTATTLPLRFTNADAVLINHIIRMEHFKAWSDAMRDMRRLFGNKQVRTAIRQYHGKDILRQIDEQLNQMARGGIEKAKINKGVDYLRRNFTRSILSIKPVIGLKQIPSVIAYITEMPFADFVEGVADFWTAPIKHFRFMRENSPYFNQRWKAGFERDIKFAMKKGYAGTLSGKGNVKNWWMAQIRGGDTLATMQGGWAKYKSTLKEKEQAEAIAAAEQTTKRTQPSFSLESLSPLQRGGSWMKLFTMFQNQPNKYFRIIADNARNVRFGRQKIGKGTINILLAWVVLPALFQFIADAFQFKKKHQLRAAILGPINHLLVIGQLAQSIYGWMTKEPFDYQASPVFSTGRDLQIAVTKTAKLVRDGKDPYKEITMDDLVKTVEYYGQAAGKVTGVPTPWAIQAERAGRKIVAKKPETGKGRLGWRKHPAAEFIFSPWALEAEIRKK